MERFPPEIRTLCDHIGLQSQSNRPLLAQSELKSMALLLRTCSPLSYREIERATSVPKSSIHRLLQRPPERSLIDLRKDNPPPSYQHAAVLTDEDIDFIRHKLDVEDCSYYLDEIQTFLTVERHVYVSTATICRTLQTRLVRPLKVRSRLSGQPLPVDVAIYWNILRGLNVNQLVWMDECCKDRRSHARKRGRAPQGSPAPINGLFTRRNERIAALLAISQAGIVGYCTQIGGTIRTETVHTFISTYVFPSMKPFPAERSVLILDNAQVHHSELLIEMATFFGIRIVFLPPYSPYMNPVEFVFSSISKYLAREGPTYHLERPTADADDDEALLQCAFESITAEECRAHIEHLGYLHL